MFSPKPSRRTVLAGLSTAALGTLAGCGSSSDSEPSPYHNWLYDPREYKSGQLGRTGLWFESPAELIAATEHLTPEIRGTYLGSNMDPDLPYDSVEWALQYFDGRVAAPIIYAYGGTFDTAAGKAVTPKGTSSAGAGELVGSVDGYDLLEYGESVSQYGLYRDGEAVTIGVTASEEDAREIATERTFGGLPEDVQQLIDRVGFETVASLNFDLAEGSELTGEGVAYAVHGETTTARYARLNSDVSTEEFRQLYGTDIDALSSVTAEQEGAVQWVEGTVDTERVGFTHDLFRYGEPRYD